MKKKYKITGMTCSACQAHVYNSVSKIDGVKNVNVNLVSNFMELETDCVTDIEIISAVKKAGYGAELYKEESLTYEQKRNSKKVRLITSIVLWILLMYVAMGHMIHLPTPSFINGPMNGLWNALLQVTLLIPIVILNFNYFYNGYKRLFKLSPNMDSLVALGSTAAVMYGVFEIAMLIIGTASNNVSILERYYMNFYFEGAGTVLTLVSVGKYIESFSKSKTSSAIKKLLDLSGNKAIRISNSLEEEIDIKNIEIGDILKVTAGMNVPVDGIIIEGEASFNESSLTGESLPVFHKSNDKVLSGISNIDGVIIMKATTTYKDSTIARIVNMVEEAGNSKAPIAKLADKISGIFVPIVLGLSVITFIIWMICTKDISFTLNLSVSVLVISCPCALGLATPLAIMIGTGIGARNHVLIKNAEALQRLSTVNTVILDKTGTITKGNLEVVEVKAFDDHFLEILYSLEMNSSHPLAKAIVDYCLNNKTQKLKTTSVTEYKGKGLEGTINKKVYYSGNATLMKEHGIDVSKHDTKHFSVIYVASNDKLIGYVLISDVVKKSSVKAIHLMKKLGLKVVMLTGDNIKTAEYIRDMCEIDEIKANVLPEQKGEVIKAYQDNKCKVVMIGDGINDSIALTQADIGMAIGSGSDIAIESADIVLARNDLIDAVDAIRLSKRTMLNIKMSLFFAFIYNVCAIPIAMGILFPLWGVTLNPMIAAIAMCFSSISVSLNALSLFLFKTTKEDIKMETKILVDGMMCHHCTNHVEGALKTIKGVSDVKANLDTKEVVIISNKEIALDLIKTKIKEAGYQVIE